MQVHARVGEDGIFFSRDKTDHVEGDDIAKGDVAGFVSLHEVLIYQDWTASGGQAQHKGAVMAGVEGLDALWMAGSAEALWRARIGSMHQ